MRIFPERNIPMRLRQDVEMEEHHTTLPCHPTVMLNNSRRCTSRVSPQSIRTNTQQPLLWLLKQIMAYSPRITTPPLEQLRTRQVEHLPPVPPRQRSLFPICLLQPLPNTLLVRTHRRQPILTRLPIVHAINPPLLLNLQIILEEQQQIRTRHRPTREEMFRHPPAIKVVRRSGVREDVHEQLAAWFQRARDFG